MVFDQLYTDGSTILEGMVGDFLKGTETTTGAIVGTGDGDTHTRAWLN